ncbi:tRNA (adenosine(37)-N6)-dimethylallyltransferase MiaA [Arthrobacter sp. Br18]|uniref:tRNA (adenosine(37)-N6)-dimethylallyltransferase MiaA n=1 Tax=Arthrobacter sp. Br18 TaxID=1312954 RepID=UPI0004B0A867|nr:tRNA (adenosine(37)-N6)-dimethylallyltransferase MiaA [Arthrobacter sp. Br18]
MPDADRTTPEAPVIAVVGPTGSGKSDLAVRLALELDGEIINADAMQFYRGMDIGTAKLSTTERRGVRHHLLDTLSVREEASVAAFQQAARAAIDGIRKRGKAPILTGGSGLYVRAVLDQLEFPGTDAGVRQRLEEELEKRGSSALRERLAAVDPVSAARVTDNRRLVRALEVSEITGRPFSSFMPERRYHQPALQVGLGVDRDRLRLRLGQRVHAMVAAGLRSEVEQLAGQGLKEGRTASRALGYAQFLKVLDGSLSEDAAVDETIAATRRFAKRQLTWFRGDPRVDWLDGEDPRLLEKCLSLLPDGLPAWKNTDQRASTQEGERASPDAPKAT